MRGGEGLLSKMKINNFSFQCLNRNTRSVIRGLVYIDLVVRKLKLAMDIADIFLNHCFGFMNQQIMDILKNKSKLIIRKIFLLVVLYSKIYCVRG